MPTQSKSPPITLIGGLKVVSEALADMADASKKLSAREKRVQALVTELIRIAQGSQSMSSNLLKIQIAMQRENQVFTSVSNVLKARHDTAKNAIGNIR